VSDDEKRRYLLPPRSYKVIITASRRRFILHCISQPPLFSDLSKFLHVTLLQLQGPMRQQMLTQRASGELGLIKTLFPFQLFHSDGVGRLGAESAREPAPFGMSHVVGCSSSS
jgi:hypothetical protein